MCLQLAVLCESTIETIEKVMVVVVILVVLIVVVVVIVVIIIIVVVFECVNQSLKMDWIHQTPLLDS